MRTPIFLTLAAVACITVTISFVRASDIEFGTGNGHEDQVQSEFQRAWKENKQDEASRENLAWLCCETKHYDDALKILKQLQDGRAAAAASSYLPAYSDDFAKQARVQICAAKFAEALRLYEAQLAYDRRFLAPSSPQLRRDFNNIALVKTLVGQTISDPEKRDAHWTAADENMAEAAQQAGSDPARQVIVKQNQLVLAQARGDRKLAQTYKHELQSLRANMNLKVPPVQF
jgi:hypothetical protein